MKEKYYILSLKHSQNAEYLYFLLNDADTKGVSLDVNKACVVFDKPDYPKDGLLYVPIKLIKELEREMTMFSQGDQVVFNTPENLDKLGLKEEDGVLVQVQQYYLLSTKHTEEHDDRLYFLTRDYKEEDDSIVGNIQKAWLTTYLDKDDVDYLFLEKEKVESVAGFECVENTPENLSALGLGFEFGVLCPIKEEEKQQVYYVCSGLYTQKHDKWVYFKTKITVESVTADLNNAYIETEYSSAKEGDFKIFYLEKGKVDALSFYFNGELRVRNTEENLDALGLGYRGVSLARKEDLDLGLYYRLSKNKTKEGTHLVVFYDSRGVLTTDLTIAATNGCPPEEKQEDEFLVSKILVDRLSSGAGLINNRTNLEALGLHYKDGVLCPIEEEEEEAPKEKEDSVSLLGIGLKAWSLYRDVKKKLDEYKSPTTPISKTTKLNILAATIHQVNKEKGFWDKERNVGEMLMLVTSELGEAMEAHRKGKFADWIGYQEAIEGTESKNKQEAFEQFIKDSFEDEIADAVIRLFDMAGGLNINLDKHIEAKLDYNRSRARFHGKKY